MSVEQILEQMKTVTDSMANTLAVGHGALRGTYEMALAEAQGAQIMRVNNFTPANQSYTTSRA